MNVVVVYELHWGNTAAIAEAIAEGFGPDARALTTDEATTLALMDADLVVAGGPLVAFSLTTDRMRESIAGEATRAPKPPDLSHPSMRTWLEHLPRGHGRSAAFETRVRWSPGGATSTIDHGFEAAGYRPIAKARQFIVKGKYGPLRDGELDRARQWGAELAEAMRVDQGLRSPV